ncbi:MAG: LuxR C-terminal-related transcriptional regulator [Henriciella sp.]
MGQTVSDSEERRADAALQLLRSLSKAGEDPDLFAQACLDWSRLSDDAVAAPDFVSVLTMLSSGGRTGAPSDLPNLPSDYEAQDIFSIGAEAKITSISSELSAQLGLTAGDTITAPLEARADIGEEQIVLIEIPDRFKIKRQVRVYPLVGGDGVTGYIARAVFTRLKKDVRQHLKSKFSLTPSEIDILELVLQRHSLEQVTDLRGIKLNTVRTHVSRLIQKLGCHSLVEAVSTTMEISNAVTLDAPNVPQTGNSGERTARQIALETAGLNMEYRRYGPSTGRPVMVLHSLEYGYVPSESMIEAARDLGLNLIFPIRPGFGATTARSSIEEASASLKEFIRVLDLQEVALIGLSTAAPLALAVQDENSRIGRTVLVNYGLNVGDKLSAIQPNWIRGLLRMSLSSPASFTFGARTVSSMIRTFGGLRFYRMLYRNQDSDQTYLEENTEMFRLNADYIAQADRLNIHLDIKTAFLPNPDIEVRLSRARSVCVLNSTDQHGVGPEKSKADADRLGVTFKYAPHPGRNWMFQHPQALFRELMA